MNAPARKVVVPSSESEARIGSVNTRNAEDMAIIGGALLDVDGEPNPAATTRLVIEGRAFMMHPTKIRSRRIISVLTKRSKALRERIAKLPKSLSARVWAEEAAGYERIVGSIAHHVKR